MTKYNSWPLGQLPKGMQRREPEMIRGLGYEWTDPRDIITLFENKVAEFAGAKYAVAIDCCTHAIELCLRYRLHTGALLKGQIVIIPAHTYVSVYHLLINLGFEVKFYDDMQELNYDQHWKGTYVLFGAGVIDGAVRWERRMYQSGLHCLSFQIKKRIPIGRGGMVLTDDKDAADWIRLAAYDGRDLNIPYDAPGHVKFPGFHYYMTPEDAARGIFLMDMIVDEGDSADWTNYPNLKTMLNL